MTTLRAKRRAARRIKVKRRWWVRLKLCRVCGWRDPMPGTLWCGVCSEANTEQKNRWRHANQAAGKCRCGREREDEDRKLCRACRLASQRHNQKHRAKAKEAAA